MLIAILYVGPGWKNLAVLGGATALLVAETPGGWTADSVRPAG